MIYTQGNCFTIFSLKVLTYTLILGNIKTNGLITTTKNPLVYYEIFFIPITFEVTILSTLTFNIIKYLLGFFVSPNLNIILLSKTLLSLLFS